MNDRPRTRRITGVLKQSGDGWALTAADGRVLYEAHGRSARILCLRRANELGALRIRS
jgi:hypothetical protein